MAIVSSVILADDPQRDGRRRVIELHVDHLGAQYRLSYLAEPAFDAVAGLPASAARIVSDSQAAEIAANIVAITTLGALATVTLAYSTLGQLRAALRAAYQAATRTEAIFIGDFLSALSDAQLQALFGMTVAQVITLRANKLTPAANAAATIRASSGA